MRLVLPGGLFATGCCVPATAAGCWLDGGVVNALFEFELLLKLLGVPARGDIDEVFVVVFEGVFTGITGVGVVGALSLSFFDRLFSFFSIFGSGSGSGISSTNASSSSLPLFRFLPCLRHGCRGVDRTRTSVGNLQKKTIGNQFRNQIIYHVIPDYKKKRFELFPFELGMKLFRENNSLHSLLQQLACSRFILLLLRFLIIVLIRCIHRIHWQNM